MTEESGEICYYANAVIWNFSSGFYDVEFNAIAIIENGGAYTYAKAVSTSRSLYYVVNSAVLDKYTVYAFQLRFKVLIAFYKLLVFSN